jgi:hypothetical protein
LFLHPFSRCVSCLVTSSTSLALTVISRFLLSLLQHP